MRFIMVVGLLVLSAHPALASKVIFGSSEAQRCFEFAKFGQTATGIEVCTKAIRSGELSRRDLASTYVNRGVLYNRMRQYDKAITDFGRALQIRPELGEAFLNRGNSYFFMRRFERALEDYTAAIDNGSRDLHAAYFNRGLVYEIIGEFDKAEADFRKALELAPDFVPAQAKVREFEERQ